MKKTLVSLATASLIASTAMAADKGIDFVTTGQAALYYQTNDADALFSKNSSIANLGVQLNNDADLGNGFALGSQLTYLGTSGLETSTVSNITQDNTGPDELSVTKMNLSKKVGNTTIKLGRQELPKSLSPLAFSEGWNVYKNTFDAALVVNSDIEGLTLVGAAVGTSNSSKDIGAWGSLNVVTGLDLDANGKLDDKTTANGAYMITAQTTLIPLATITGSYYVLGNLGATAATSEGATAIWLDAKITDKSLPMGLKLGVQSGTITPENSGLDATTAIGAKLGLAPVDGLNLCFAYSSVDDGVAAVKNTGTGVKTPLYTQMILNQDAIALDADTIMVSGAYSLGDSGKVIARMSTTTAGDTNNLKGADFTDTELIYKVKSGGVDYLAAYVNTALDDGSDAVSTIRVVARYNF